MLKGSCVKGPLFPECAAIQRNFKYAEAFENHKENISVFGLSLLENVMSYTVCGLIL